MSFACEQPVPGAAIDHAAALRAHVPELVTERLRLRAPRLDDFPAYAEIACTTRGAFIGGPMSREDGWFDFLQLSSGWLLHGFGGWTICLKGSETPLGFAVLGFEPGDQEPELGYLLVEEAEGHGYALEAARAARGFGIGKLRLPTLVSYVDAGNTRSLALARRLGAAQAGEIATDDGQPPALIFRHPKPETA